MQYLKHHSFRPARNFLIWLNFQICRRAGLLVYCNTVCLCKLVLYLDYLFTKFAKGRTQQDEGKRHFLVPRMHEHEIRKHTVVYSKNNRKKNATERTQKKQ